MKHFVLCAVGMLLCSGVLAQEMSVSTNLLDYVNLCTMNVGASYGFARHWTADAGVRYNPFAYGEGKEEKSLKQRSVQLGASYWPWHIYSGCRFAAGARWQEFSSSGISSRASTEGNRYGGGISVGYSHMLAAHLNIDFGLGIWGGREIYVVYECPHCGRKIDSGSKYFILPNDIVLSLSYIF